MQIRIDIPDNPESLSYEELQAAAEHVRVQVQRVNEERRRLDILADAQRRAEQLAQQYLEARDGVQPTPPPGVALDLIGFPEWKQPLGSFDAYPHNYVVKYGGKFWKSDRPFNVWKPGTQDSGWSEVTTETDVPEPPEPEDTSQISLWAPGVNYKAGEKCLYNGVVYEVVQAHTSLDGWNPEAVPALFKRAL